MSKDKFTYGPSGSGISRRDGYTDSPPDMDTDFMWKYKKEIISPPVKLPDSEYTIEDFDELMDKNFDEFDLIAKEIALSAGVNETIEDMEQWLMEPEKKLREYAIAKSRRNAMSAKEHFGIIERNAWNREQVWLLGLFDERRKEAQVERWKVMADKLRKKMSDAKGRIVENHGKEGWKAFKRFGERYIETQKPEDSPDYIKYLKRLSRRMALWNTPTLARTTWQKKIAPVIESGKVPSSFARILIDMFYNMAKQNDFESYMNLSELLNIALPKDTFEIDYRCNNCGNIYSHEIDKCPSCKSADLEVLKE